MKKIIFSTFFLAGMAGNFLSAQDAYYWYKGQKVPLSKNESKRFVIYSEPSSTHAVDLKANVPVAVQAKGILQNPAGNIPHGSFKGLSGRWAVLESKQAILSAKAPGDIRYEAPFYKLRNHEAGLSNFFYVKLRSSADLNALEKLAQLTGAEIVGQNAFMPEWYTLAASKESSGNALELANQFYESGLFLEAAPDFMQNYGEACVNDPLFPQQWNLRNTGQLGTSGNDIRACSAWNTTTGSSSIVIAVVDQGIQLNHPDLLNLASLSYDTHTGTSPSQIRGNHGTACAGIAGAARNNSKGIAGVAPGCKLMSVSDSLTFTPDASQRLANGINFAWQNGAAVISNSWAGSDFASPILDDAISKALNLGR
ncbi:MAG TPA: S8 family serine peptidase, partial [Cytophagales bacterium]|nr:S8 family serine peptidase [Cytophagales bacterium]